MLRPLLPPGRNAIVAYVGSIFLKMWILQVWQAPSSWRSSAGANLQDGILQQSLARFGPVGGGWVYTLGFVGAWWIWLAVMDRKGWIVKL